MLRHAYPHGVAWCTVARAPSAGAALARALEAEAPDAPEAAAAAAAPPPRFDADAVDAVGRGVHVVEQIRLRLRHCAKHRARRRTIGVVPPPVLGPDVHRRVVDFVGRMVRGEAVADVLGEGRVAFAAKGDQVVGVPVLYPSREASHPITILMLDPHRPWHLRELPRHDRGVVRVRHAAERIVPPNNGLGHGVRGGHRVVEQVELLCVLEVPIPVRHLARVRNAGLRCPRNVLCHSTAPRHEIIEHEHDSEVALCQFNEEEVETLQNPSV